MTLQKKKSVVSPCRPEPADYVAAPGAFVDAMRRYRQLGYQALALAVSRQVRGKKRKGSANYFYRLCQEKTDLRSDLIDGLARALGLSDAEQRFLQKSVNSDAKDEIREYESDLRDILRVLDGSVAGKKQKRWVKLLADPLVFAVYALAGSGRSIRDFARLVARSATHKVRIEEVRQAVRLLTEAGLITEKDGQPLQEDCGLDLAIFAGDQLGDRTRREAMKHFYRLLDDWGSDALRKVDREQRYFASLVFLTREEDLPALASELETEWRTLKNRLRKKYETTVGDTVVHLGVRQWPMVQLSKRLQGGNHA